ncbi:MAG: ribosomal protein S18-alanine N-acetyltransferase [Chloroflexota bacterium]
MRYYVRPMSESDIAQVNDIEREAFPTQWPSPNYQRELRNQVGHYLVACDGEKPIEVTVVPPPPAPKGLARLGAGLRALFGSNHSHEDKLSPPGLHYIVGMVGFWIMVDEAHITTIAVREKYRRQGIGELLLMSAIDLALELEAREVTLEVRISNTGAQDLYTKYGFNQTGVRRGYYTDNREDALVMTTEKISSATFQTKFRQLKQAYYQKERDLPVSTG